MLCMLYILDAIICRSTVLIGVDFMMLNAEKAVNCETVDICARAHMVIDLILSIIIGLSTCILCLKP
jgi:uncharacterized membrane protein